jgi:hypothetical protein
MLIEAAKLSLVVASWTIGLIQNGAVCWRDQTAAVGDGPVRTPGRTRT